MAYLGGNQSSFLIGREKVDIKPYSNLINIFDYFFFLLLNLVAVWFEFTSNCDC